MNCYYTKCDRVPIYERTIGKRNFEKKVASDMTENMLDERLTKACLRCNLKQVVELVEKQGVDIHSLNDLAFRHSCEFGYLEIVKYLVHKGADIHACYDQALYRAKLNLQTEIVKYLKNRMLLEKLEAI
jgi:hypothetical protein